MKIFKVRKPYGKEEIECFGFSSLTKHKFQVGEIYKNADFILDTFIEQNNQMLNLNLKELGYRGVFEVLDKQISPDYYLIRDKNRCIDSKKTKDLEFLYIKVLTTEEEINNFKNNEPTNTIDCDFVFSCDE